LKRTLKELNLAGQEIPEKENPANMENWPVVVRTQNTMNEDLKLKNAWRDWQRFRELDRIRYAVPLYRRFGPDQVGINHFGLAFFCAELCMVAYDDKTERFFRLDKLQVEPPLPLTTAEVEYDLKAVIQVFANEAASIDRGLGAAVRATDPESLIGPLKKVALIMPSGSKQATNTSE
jgi:hypothetical protein